jgi:hypothetical protein
MAEARIRPRTGWVRADQARSAEDDQRERELRDELNEAQKYIEQLERTLRDRAVLVDELPRDQLAQGDDIIEITITFTDKTKTVVSENVGLTWDEIFKVIGPAMYGYITKRRQKGYSQEPTYPFQDNLEDHIRAKIIDRVQTRKIKIQQSQIDACILQFKELGLVEFTEKSKEDGRVFRGVTLTELGERRLTSLNMRLREPKNLVGNFSRATRLPMRSSRRKKSPQLPQH